MAEPRQYPYRLEESTAFRVMATGVWLVSLMVILGVMSTREPAGGFWQYGGYLAAAGATFWWWTSIRERVTLYEDRLEFRDGLRTVVLQKSRIEGYSAWRSRYGQITLTFRDTSGRRVVTRDYRGDAMFSAWTAGIGGLDARDHADSEKALAANPAFGASQQQRAATLARHKTIVLAINAAGALAAAWLALFPFPEKLLVWTCAAFPALMFLLAAASGGRYGLLFDDRTPNLKLTIALLAPALALALHYFRGDAMIDRLVAVIPAVICGGLLALLAGRIDGRLSTYPALFCAVALSLGCWGGLMAYDQVADSAAPQAFITTVSDKHIENHRGYISYILTYAPWARDGMQVQIKVGIAEYNTTRVGEPACIWLHPGALGYRWFEHAACPGAPAMKVTA